VITGNLIGLRVKLARPIDQKKPCCRNLAIIGAGSGPHAGEFRCVDCNRHRGWLSQSTASWISEVVNRFGAPTTPIVVRPSSLDQGGAKPENNPS
jgi:hypothetical protein